MNRDEAVEAVKESLTRAVPGADLAEVGPDDDLREVLALDSLDFLAFAEALSARIGRSIDEADYPALRTPASCADYLTAQRGAT